MARETIKYDPNYSGDGDDIDMTDAEDDGWGGSDYGGEEDMNDDDTAWKVRKASTKIVDALVTVCPGQLKDYWAMFIDLMSDRFSERDSNVKCDIFAVFQNLVKSSVFVDADQSGGSEGALSMAKRQSSTGP